ncbi:MAG: hypothetical protein OEM29_01865 [Thermoplasmata archaeon]|nr:hypothetical protein [Thermoplasmata archaeon]
MKKDFQKSSDEDIDAFLARKKSSQPASQKDSSSQTFGKPKPSQGDYTDSKKRDDDVPREETDEEKEDQIRVARTGRAQAEAYRDVAVLRKKAHEHSHKAAQFYHKHKANQAKAQKCSSRAVAHREKSDDKHEKAKVYRASIKDYEGELAGIADDKSDLSPEALQNKIAGLERKAAKQEEIARKREHAAALQTEKAAKFRSRAARFLEKSRLHESEARMFTKRADNLEKAG